MSKSIILTQTPISRAINLGYIAKDKFIPGRLSLGYTRQQHTFLATVESLNLPEIKKILKKYSQNKISTITLLREGLACNLGAALSEVGIKEYYGDVFIGVSHFKKKGEIKAKYFYENVEGLCEGGLWIIAESICKGRNLEKTLISLLKNHQPKEIIFICPIASSIGINKIIQLFKNRKIKVTFVAWGALFGVSEKNLYDMPWGHKDTEPKDSRDQKTFVNIYGELLCVAGDFGNNYYAPYVAEKVYKEQLLEHKISPKIPSVKEILKTYKKEEFLIWDK